MEECESLIEPALGLRAAGNGKVHFPQRTPGASRLGPLPGEARVNRKKGRSNKKYGNRSSESHASLLSGSPKTVHLSHDESLSCAVRDV
jgi:hypothetical protein